MNTGHFTREEAFLRSFEAWLQYQGVDPVSTSAEMLAIWRKEYQRTRRLAALQPKIGRMKLRRMSPGERRYAVAVRDSDGLWLTLWLSRSRRGEFFVMVPRGQKGWDPHTSYHADGAFHMKTHDQKLMTRKLQPLKTLQGAVHLGSYHGHAPKSEGAVCDPADFTAVVEVPVGILGPRNGAVTVDLVQPGHLSELHEHPWADVYRREVFNDAEPWVVITVGRGVGEASAT